MPDDLEHSLANGQCVRAAVSLVLEAGSWDQYKWAGRRDRVTAQDPRRADVFGGWRWGQNRTWLAGSDITAGHQIDPWPPA